MTVIKFNCKKNVLAYAIKFLERKKIEVRPVWKILCEQKKYKKYERFEVKNAKKYMSNCLCIPSSTSLKLKEIKIVAKNLNLLAERFNK